MHLFKSLIFNYIYRKIFGLKPKGLKSEDLDKVLKSIYNTPLSSKLDFFLNNYSFFFINIANMHSIIIISNISNKKIT